MSDIVRFADFLVPDFEKEWVVEDFSKIRTWLVQELTDELILQQGALWYTDVCNGTISAQTAIRGLKLALSLKSPDPDKTEPLIVQQPRQKDPENGTNTKVPIPDISNFGDTPFALRSPQNVPTDSQQAVISVTKSNTLTEVESMVLPDTDRKRMHSYGFLAAFMMKLLVKSSDNIVNSIDTLKIRHASFYGPSRIVQNFKMSLEKATAYKYALSNEMILFTYTHAIAYTHQELFSGYNQKEMGTFTYLCAIPFSYTGMRTYTLILEIQSMTGIDLKHILKMFNCNVMKNSISTIANIATNYERNETNPNRDLTFRYCTHWSPQYFSSVRSKKSAYLLYTAACAWKVLNNTNTRSDPEKIFAIRGIPAAMKNMLKKAGTIIGNSLRELAEEGRDHSIAATINDDAEEGRDHSIAATINDDAAEGNMAYDEIN